MLTVYDTCMTLADMFPTRRTRSVAALVHGLLPIALVATFAILLMANGEPVVRWVATDAQREATAEARWWDNEPTFSDVRADFPECVSMRQWNRDHADLAADDLARIPTTSVTVHLDGSVHREPTDVAWEKADTLPGSTYWIVGGCAA